VRCTEALQVNLSSSPPPVGLTFVDDDGVLWVVKNVIQGTNLDGFFLASLNHGRTPECSEGNMVLAPREYEALIRSRGLKVIAPDVARPVRLLGVEVSSPGLGSIR
jgi:hypothetical protein